VPIGTHGRERVEVGACSTERSKIGCIYSVILRKKEGWANAKQRGNLFEHQATMWEVMSLAGPSLRVLKQLRKKCSLCNYIHISLNFEVFSDKDYKL